MDDYDDHAEALAAEEEQRIEDDYQHEMAIAENMAEREANEAEAARRREQW
jgi:hypothetical protein